MDRELKSAERRAYRYWYEDGFIDLLLGAFFLLVGVTSLLQDAQLPGGLVTALNVARVIVVLAAALALRRIVRKLKQQVTYPRTGYVGYRQRPGWLRWVRVGTGLVTGVLIGLLAASRSEAVRWLPVLVGIVIGVAHFYVGTSFHLTRYHLLALVAVLLGSVVAWLDLSGTLQLALLLGGVGCAQIIAGAVTLIGYLRRHPRQEDDL